MRKLRILAAMVFVIVLICIALDFILPVGLIEGITNFSAGLGGGAYPISVYGSDVLDIKASSIDYFMLTDTKLSALNDSGKEIISITHGFSNPFMVTSESRALIFDQGGNEVSVYGK